MGLEDPVSGLAGVAAFMDSIAIANVSYSALDTEELSSAIFNSFLLLTLLTSKIGERLLSGLLFFFFFSSEGLNLTF